jgi:PhoPQ-activated pathogenicity-related protein
MLQVPPFRENVSFVGAGDRGEQTARETSRIHESPIVGPTKLITNVSKPTITIYRTSKDKNTGTAMLICPRGGSWDLYWELEGEEVAAWLNSLGMTGIILKYRVLRRPGEVRDEPPPGPLLDAQRAVSLVRSRAVEWGIDPQRIGMVGFSAGDPRTKLLYAIEDPYSYRDRLTMPKFIVNASGDQYFPPDSSQFYFGDLPGEKYLRYVRLRLIVHTLGYDVELPHVCQKDRRQVWR